MPYAHKCRALYRGTYQGSWVRIPSLSPSFVHIHFIFWSYLGGLHAFREPTISHLYLFNFRVAFRHNKHSFIYCLSIVVWSFNALLICLYLQEDYRKITVERKGETNFFTSEMIKSCMKKTIAVNLHQTVQVGTNMICFHLESFVITKLQ